jgi:hypothetical protein
MDKWGDFMNVVWIMLLLFSMPVYSLTGDIEKQSIKINVNSLEFGHEAGLKTVLKFKDTNGKYYSFRCGSISDKDHLTLIRGKRTSFYRAEDCVQKVTDLAVLARYGYADKVNLEINKKFKGKEKLMNIDFPARSSCNCGDAESVSKENSVSQ